MTHACEICDYACDLAGILQSHSFYYVYNVEVIKFSMLFMIKLKKSVYKYTPVTTYGAL